MQTLALKLNIYNFQRDVLFRSPCKSLCSHHFRPKTPTDDELASGLLPNECLSPTPSSTEFNVESFQNHQEQLLQMQQRQQEEQLLQQDSLTPVAASSSSTDLSQPFSPQHLSKFTLDSASAAFAASAVHNSANELIQSSSVAPAPTPLPPPPPPTSLIGSNSLHGAITNSSSQSTSNAAVISSITMETLAVTMDTSRSSSPAVKPVAVQHNGPTVDNSTYAYC